MKMDGKSRTEIENDSKEREGISDRKSAGVCTENCEEKETASQRINAKELKYILGLIEAEGRFSCYTETRESKEYLRTEMAIGLEEAD